MEAKCQKSKKLIFEIFPQTNRKNNPKRKKYYLNSNSYQLISAGNDGHFGNPELDEFGNVVLNGKWYPEGLNYDEYDADNITSFGTTTLGNSIP